MADNRPPARERTPRYSTERGGVRREVPGPAPGGSVRVLESDDALSTPRSEVALDFADAVLAPRTRTWTSTIVPARTDMGLAPGTRELGVAKNTDALGGSGLFGPRVIRSQNLLSVAPTL